MILHFIRFYSRPKHDFDVNYFDDLFNRFCLNENTTSLIIMKHGGSIDENRELETALDAGFVNAFESSSVGHVQMYYL